MNNIEDWVANFKDKEDEKFRQVIHIILQAIARSKSLESNLIMKGGIAMSLVYGGGRYTSDLDLTSVEDINQMTTENLKEHLSKSLVAVTALSDYPLDVSVQSIKKLPKNHTKPRFPAYKVKIGYADSSNRNAVERLTRGESPSVVDIDISFNESIAANSTINYRLNDKQNVLCYSLEQILAEKYRSILQQQVRKRSRRQDVIDISFLLEEYGPHLQKSSVKQKVLQNLVESSKDKGIEKYLHQNGLKNKDIRNLSIQEVKTLEQEMDLNLNPELVNQMYDKINDYFMSLPW